MAIAKLVMLTFVGPCPDGYTIAKMNWIPEDDRLQNLQYMTPQETRARYYRKCEDSSRGEKHPRHKLTECAVKLMRKKYASANIWKRQQLLAEWSQAYGVHPSTARNAAMRKSWKHVA